MIKALYIIAIGLLFAAVVGLGIETFYPQPKYPDYPSELKFLPAEENWTDDQRVAQERYDQEIKRYTEESGAYNSNVSLVLIVIALLTLIVSIIGIGKIAVIGDGLTLGGVLTLIYGLGRAVVGGDEKIRFLAVVLGLVVLIFLTHWKFIRDKSDAPPRNEPS